MGSSLPWCSLAVDCYMAGRSHATATVAPREPRAAPPPPLWLPLLWQRCLARAYADVHEAQTAVLSCSSVESIRPVRARRAPPAVACAPPLASSTRLSWHRAGCDTKKGSSRGSAGCPVRGAASAGLAGWRRVGRTRPRAAGAGVGGATRRCPPPPAAPCAGRVSPAATVFFFWDTASAAAAPFFRGGAPAATAAGAVPPSRGTTAFAVRPTVVKGTAGINRS